MKRLVVFFPSWRYFGHLALPLFEPLADRYEITFFHTEKAVYGWADFPDLSDKGIKTVDLKTLGTFSFIKALKQLKPDCLVVLDKGWVQDRAILHAVRFLGIPSIQIQHGSVAIIESPTTKSFFKRAATEFVKILKTFRLYNTTVIRTGIIPWLKSVPFQLQLFLNPNNYYYNYRSEVTADLACITGASDREFFIRKEGYREDQLVEMGNQNYERAYALRDEPVPENRHNRILLIPQPLFEDHILPGGNEKKREFMEGLLDAVDQLDGVSLAVKPHPRENTEWYRANFSEDRLHVYGGKTDVNDAVWENRYAIGFFSAALINAIIMRIPLGIIRWVDDSMYGLEFDQDGAAIPLQTVDDLKKIVAAPENTFNPSFYAYDRSVQTVLTETIDKACG